MGVTISPSQAEPKYIAIVGAATRCHLQALELFLSVGFGGLWAVPAESLRLSKRNLRVMITIILRVQ